MIPFDLLIVRNYEINRARCDLTLSRHLRCIFGLFHLPLVWRKSVKIHLIISATMHCIKWLEGHGNRRIRSAEQQFYSGGKRIRLSRRFEPFEDLTTLSDYHWK